MAKTRKAGYMISAIAEQYQIHPQTLRLYEREGLLKPSRSEGNTRLYTEEDMDRLEVILKLTRDLGVNLAGVEIILNMREKMEEMQRQIETFVSSLNTEMSTQRARSTTARGPRVADSGDRDQAFEEVLASDQTGRNCLLIRRPFRRRLSSRSRVPTWPSASRNRKPGA